MQRWRGLKSLIVDAVEHGSRAVERVQKETDAGVSKVDEIIVAKEKEVMSV